MLFDGLALANFRGACGRTVEAVIKFRSDELLLALTGEE